MIISFTNVPSGVKIWTRCLWRSHTYSEIVVGELGAMHRCAELLRGLFARHVPAEARIVWLVAVRAPVPAGSPDLHRQKHGSADQEGRRAASALCWP